MNVSVLVDLNRNVFALLIFRRDLGVVVLVLNVNTSVLLRIGRVDRLHTRRVHNGLGGHHEGVSINLLSAGNQNRGVDVTVLCVRRNLESSALLEVVDRGNLTRLTTCL